MQPNEKGEIIATSVRLLETKKLKERNDAERKATATYGPAYQIIHSLNYSEAALAEKEALIEQHGGRVRVKMVPAREEMEKIAAGDFTVINIKETQNNG